MLTRRHLLQYSPSALLAAGLWPGVLAAGDTDTKDCHFLVVNDLHSLDKKCGPWFEKVVKSMAAHKEKPEFLAICGDLAEDGTAEQLSTTKETFAGLKLPLYTTPGNHDYTKDQTRKPYDELFPNKLNYTFDLNGWQFVVLDTT
jgi:predicted MPP superfamily phosphohydrolase